MVDVVANHNGWSGSESSTDYSKFNPFNSASYYHTPCTIDYSNQDSIEDCWLGDNTVALPDLKTEDSGVASQYYTWIKSLVSNYSSKLPLHFTFDFSPVCHTLENKDLTIFLSRRVENRHCQACRQGLLAWFQQRRWSLLYWRGLQR